MNVALIWCHWASRTRHCRLVIPWWSLTSRIWHRASRQLIRQSCRLPEYLDVLSTPGCSLCACQRNPSFRGHSHIRQQQAPKSCSSISMVNARLEGFVRAAALEMPRSLRINAVSSPWVKETMVKLGMDPTSGLASADVAKAYLAAVDGAPGIILDPHHLGK